MCDTFSFLVVFFFFFQAEDGIRDYKVTGVQTCALPICCACCRSANPRACYKPPGFGGGRPGSLSYPLFEQLRESNELPQQPRIPPIFAGFSRRRPAVHPGSGPHRQNSPCAEDHGREASPSPGAPAVGSQEDAAGNQNRLIAV